MRKYLSLFLSILTLVGILHMKVLFAGDDEANKYYLDAYNLYKLGKMDESLEMLKKVIEINPDHAEAHFGMGSIYFRQNMFDDAVKEFTKVTRIKPEYVEAYQRLWLAYKKLGMHDKAEEELLKYKRLIEERMQAMGGGAPTVAKPVTPPPKREERIERHEHETPEEHAAHGEQVTHDEHTAHEEHVTHEETRPHETTVSETRVAESRPSETETETEKPAVVKPVTPKTEETRHSVAEPGSPIVQMQTKPIETRPAESPKVPTEMKSATKLDTESSSPYITVDKKNPAYQSLFKPFKHMGSALFKSPLKKGAEKWKKTYFGRLAKGFIYYIMIVQIWLCIVASFCIYFRKAKRE